MKKYLFIVLLVGVVSAQGPYTVGTISEEEGLRDGPQIAGYKSIQWNATNDRNEPVSAGLYLYTIQARDFRQTKKMVLLK